MGKCKILEKCKKCGCKNKDVGLAEKIQIPRPTERVIERQIVELASRCKADCDCNETS